MVKVGWFFPHFSADFDPNCQCPGIRLLYFQSEAMYHFRGFYFLSGY